MPPLTGLGFLLADSSTNISLLTELGEERNVVCFQSSGILSAFSQGSSCRATLGWRAESRWDSETERLKLKD